MNKRQRIALQRGMCREAIAKLRAAVEFFADEYLMQKTEDSKRLNECLRMADWPGKPGRAECERLYGR